jgi:hypothetical protein
VKRKAYAGDPFKKPDTWVKIEEDARDDKNEVRDKMGVLLQEKEQFISNLTVQKQRLEDIVREMETERVGMLDEIENLKGQVDRWRGNEVDTQELDRMRIDHNYLRE